MNYHNIVHCDFGNNLEGVGVTLFVSGCDGHPKCKGCHNPQTWDYDSGIPFGNRAKKEIFEALEDDYVKVFTVTGGDPLSPKNREDVLNLLKEVKEKFPTKHIWLYTGFLYEEVQDLEILEYVDVLVDGPFIEELKDDTCTAFGSSNQRMIELKDGKYFKLFDSKE